MKQKVVSIAMVFMLVTAVSFTQATALAWALEEDNISRLNRTYGTDLRSNQEISREDFCVIAAKLFGVSPRSDVTPHGIYPQPKESITAEEAVVSSYLGTGSRGHFDGGLKESRLTLPYAVLLDGDGNLIVLDTYNNLIRKTNSGKVEVVTGSVTALDDYGFAKGHYRDSEPEKSLLNRPTSAVFNKDGELFFADSANHVIRFIRNERVFTFSGSAAGYQDGTAEDARFNNPMAIAIDEKDNIYVADTLNHCIRKIDPEGNVTTIAGVPEEEGFADGSADAALFREPAGIAVSGDGSVIYVSDTGNHKIRKIEKGEVITLAGTITETDEEGAPYGGFMDGSREQAQFNLPRGLTLAEGHLIIADSGNNRIRIMTKDGRVMTLCGNGEPGDKDGPAPESSLNQPMGVYFHEGLVYIADTTNNKIKVMPFNSALYMDSE